MEKGKFLAELKILRNIASSYISLWVYITVILIYLDIKIETVFVMMFFIGCMVLTLVDRLWIWPKEQEITWQNNPAYKKLEERK